MKQNDKFLAGVSFAIDSMCRGCRDGLETRAITGYERMHYRPDAKFGFPCRADDIWDEAEDADFVVDLERWRKKAAE